MLISQNLMLYKNFNIFFDKINFKLFLKGATGLVVMNIVQNFYFDYDKFSISFLFTSKREYVSFLNLFIVTYNKLFYYYFYKLKLIGLGFRVRKIACNLFCFFFTSTNFYYLHVPTCVLLKIKKRKLFFLSYNFCVLRTILVILLSLKKLIVYRLRGLVYPRQIYTSKPGKKRF